ncbi:MAG: hypothetical protein BGO77_02000 [Caedibacter sp. 37-49]|nr:MAG: hypothetical protein BGO77_02000 [Caedibacter sp. 37-49]
MRIKHLLAISWVCLQSMSDCWGSSVLSDDSQKTSSVTTKATVKEEDVGPNYFAMLPDDAFNEILTRLDLKHQVSVIFSSKKVASKIERWDIRKRERHTCYPSYPYDQNIEIPTSFRFLNNLKILYLLGPSEGCLPTELGQLIQLTDLNLSRHSFLYPEAFNSLKVVTSCTNLNRLGLNNSNLPDLPMEFTTLVNLKELNIGFNHFHGELPRVVSLLPTLEILIAKFCNIRRLDPCMTKLTNLTKLDLSYNSIASLDWRECETIFCLSNLKKLILKGCSSNSRFSDDFIQLTNLEMLDLSYSSLNGGCLPSFIPNLKSLQKLKVAHTALKKIGPELLKLPFLQEIDVTDNNLRIRTLDFLKLCSNIKIIGLSSNSRLSSFFDSTSLDEVTSLTISREMLLDDTSDDESVGGNYLPADYDSDLSEDEVGTNSADIN